MTNGRRIKYFRKRCGMKQKELGQKLGFSEGTADARIAQYETDARNARDGLTENMAVILGVAPEAISVPSFDTPEQLMHLLFALEDTYGLTAATNNGIYCLMSRADKDDTGNTLRQCLREWHEMRIKLLCGKINREEYDLWRYNYPAYRPCSEAMDKDRVIEACTQCTRCDGTCPQVARLLGFLKKTAREKGKTCIATTLEM